MSRKQAKDEPGSNPAPATSRDIALIHGRTADGEGLQILRHRDERLEVGAVKPLKEGVPITGEVVTLRPRAEFPLLCDVEVAYAPARDEKSDVASSAPSRRGPAQVASQSYRENWDAIWNRAPKKRELSN